MIRYKNVRIKKSSSNICSTGSSTKYKGTIDGVRVGGSWVMYELSVEAILIETKVLFWV